MIEHWFCEKGFISNKSKIDCRQYWNLYDELSCISRGEINFWSCSLVRNCLAIYVLVFSESTVLQILLCSVVIHSIFGLKARNCPRYTRRLLLRLSLGVFATVLTACWNHRRKLRGQPGHGLPIIRMGATPFFAPPHNHSEIFVKHREKIQRRKEVKKKESRNGVNFLKRV